MNLGAVRNGTVIRPTRDRDHISFLSGLRFGFAGKIVSAYGMMQSKLSRRKSITLQNAIDQLKALMGSGWKMLA